MTKLKYLSIGLLASLAYCSSALAGDVKVSAHMASGPKAEEAVTSFTPDTKNLYTVFRAKGTKDGDKIHCVLIAEDVGNAAPANTKALETTLTVEGDPNGRDYVGDFELSKPTKGWPAGKYHVEIYVNDELATKVSFAIKAAPKSKKQADEEEEESGED
jgi:hypothetical protein